MLSGHKGGCTGGPCTHGAYTDFGEYGRDGGWITTNEGLLRGCHVAVHAECGHDGDNSSYPRTKAIYFASVHAAFIQG